MKGMPTNLLIVVAALVVALLIFMLAVQGVINIDLKSLLPV